MEADECDRWKGERSTSVSATTCKTMNVLIKTWYDEHAEQGDAAVTRDTPVVVILFQVHT